MGLFDKLRVLVYNAADVLTDSLACASHAVCVDKVFLVKLTENCINAACLVEVFHVCVTGRSKVTEVWRSL